MYWIRIDAVRSKIIKYRARVETREGTLMRKDKKMVMNLSIGKDKLLKLTNAIASSLSFSLFNQQRIEPEVTATFTSVLKMSCTRVSNTEKTSV